MNDFQSHSADERSAMTMLGWLITFVFGFLGSILLMAAVAAHADRVIGGDYTSTAIGVIRSIVARGFQ